MHDEARIRPLISLWLDLLVLRTMDDGATNKRKTWFVFDELASLQRLPQLTTAVTESRKSNSPMVLGFQGKAQIEALYGHIAESLLSQPATKIYLKTSEPKAAEWISKAIGEVEIERCRETRTHGQFPQNRNSESQQREITREPLVMASEIGGLDPLHGFLKHGNYVVRLRVPYLQLEAQHEKFIERRAEGRRGAGPGRYVRRPSCRRAFRREGSRKSSRRRSGPEPRPAALLRVNAMISMSKPISASQAQAYHKEEFANARDNYYTEGDRVRGEWQGQLAAALRTAWRSGRGAVRAACRGPASGDRRAVGTASDGAGVCERAGPDGAHDGAPGGLGCDVLARRNRYR